MSPSHAGNKSIASILKIFTTGSLIVLTISILTAALLCSMTLLEKDKQRAEILSKQLIDSFELQQRPMAEEMWTKSYEAIALRTAAIAKEFDDSDFTLILFDSDLNCVYQSDSKRSGAVSCNPDQQALGIVQGIATSPKKRSNYFAFDDNLDRYVYAAPLYLGVDLPGYFFITIEDPYDFYKTQRFSHYARILFPGAVLIVAIIGLWLIIARKYLLRPYLADLVEFERNEALGKLAARVAHDIQSPLAALTSVLQNASGLPNHQNHLLKSAASRIQSLADDLIRRYKDPDAALEIQFTLVSAVINSIIAEKVVTLGRSSKIHIHTEIDSSAKVIGIPLSSMMFSRVLSNVLNNAIDALQERSEGLIKLNVSASEETVCLVITDNGSGMTPEVLRKVKTEGGTYGKINGAGIGLRFTKETIEGIGGQLEIESQLNVGTSVTLRIPTAELPQWCASNLGLSPGDEIVVLDDDPSVLLLWKERLSDFSIVQLRDPDEFDIDSFPKDKFKYIFDYEISGSDTTGLDLIRTHEIASRTVLVTSYFNDPRVQAQVVELGTKILPKYLIGSVPLMAPGPIAIASSEELPDLILIDDDPMTHKVWKIQGAHNKKRVLAVFREADLDWSLIPKDMSVYIDLRLGDGISGFDVAKRFHGLGFSKIFITSGDPAVDTSSLPFLAGIVGKTFPCER